MNTNGDAEKLVGPRVLVVGSGPVGQTLFHGLTQAGLTVLKASRSTLGTIQTPVRLSTESDAADVAVLAVPDDAISETAQTLFSQGVVGPEAVLLHCAGGRRPSHVFAAWRGQVRGVGLLHPLRSLAAVGPVQPPTVGDGTDRPTLAGAVLALCGDEQGLRAAQTLCAALGGQPLLLNEDQLAVYHAAAVLAAGHVATLIDVAAQLFAKVGLPRAVGQKALTELTASVLRNVDQVGLPQALTGPVARGDAATVAEHLAALRKVSCQVADLYRVIAESSLDVAYRKGAADGDALDRVGEVLRVV